MNDTINDFAADQRHDRLLREYGADIIPGLPVPGNDRVVPMSPFILRSPLFGVSNKAGPYVDDVELPTGFEGSSPLKYRGKRLTQTHGTVFFGLLQAAGYTGVEFQINAKDFIQSIGWSSSAHSLRRLRAALLDLRGAVVTYRWGNANIESGVTLLDGYTFNLDNEVFTLRLHPTVVRLFQGEPTRVFLYERRRLSEGLQTWLLTYIRASKCSKHSLKHLHLLCGSSRRSMKEFGRDVRKALEALKAEGLIKDFSATRGSVYITKKGA